MDARAAALLSSLGLTPHPEGGYFREVYRSSQLVQPHDPRAARTALTTIYFLLTEGDVSRWHRVTSDEVWHHYEGDALELLTLDPAFDRVTSHKLTAVSDAGQPVHVVPAGVWQAARSAGRYTLVGCTVGPGFDVEDFTMLRDRPEDAETVRRRHPEAARFV